MADLKENGIKLENVVASTYLGIKIDLNKLVANLRGIEYEPEQFPGLVYRIKDPRAAALIFSSGKIVCTGATSPEKAREAIEKIINGMKSSGIKTPSFKKIKIQIENIVASAKLPGELKLDKIAFTLPNAEYEPEQFPGLVYRMEEPKVAFLLFGSGKIVCTGGKSMDDVQEAIKKLQKTLKEESII